MIQKRVEIGAVWTLTETCVVHIRAVGGLQVGLGRGSSATFPAVVGVVEFRLLQQAVCGFVAASVSSYWRGDFIMVHLVVAR